MKDTVLEFDEDCVSAIGEAFAKVVRQEKYTCYACAIMPDHVHVLIRRHRDQAEQMIANLQRESHIGLRDAGLRTMEHPVWGGKGWKVFLEDEHDIRRTIAYVKDNPIKIRLPKQRWSFVTPYDGCVGGRVTVVRGRNDAQSNGL